MKPPITLMPYPNKLHVGDLASGPDELRKIAANCRLQGFLKTADALDAAADAWEAERAKSISIFRIHKERFADYRKRLEAAERWKRGAIEVMRSEGIYSEECVEATVVMLEDEDAALAPDDSGGARPAASLSKEEPKP